MEVDADSNNVYQEEAEWRARLSQLFALYGGRVLLLGNCMGGTAALLFRDLCPAVRGHAVELSLPIPRRCWLLLAQGVAVAFAPQTSFVRARGLYWLMSLRLPSTQRSSLEKRIHSCNTKVASCLCAV
jgi:hypothetical protein